MTPAAVIATLTGYIALLFVVAWISGRRTDNAGFFTANRRTPWYLAAFAMVGAAMSGVTFISVPGSVAADSFSYMQMVAGFTVGQLIVAYLLVPTFYRLRLVSLYEYLDDRFGARTHAAGAWCFFVAKMLGAALQVYVVCTVMQLLVFDCYGLPFWLNAAVTMALVWLYTRQGGVRSLIRTDILKTCCLIASLVLSILFITRALGPDISADCDGYICPMAPGDYLLLCTDGLVDTVTDQEMLFEVIHGEGPDSCLDRLLAISKSRGASDNVTAVLMLMRKQ